LSPGSALSGGSTVPVNFSHRVLEVDLGLPTALYDRPPGWVIDPDVTCAPALVAGVLDVGTGGRYRRSETGKIKHGSKSSYSNTKLHLHVRWFSVFLASDFAFVSSNLTVKTAL